jgi:methyl-accepting chemotaxis protein
MCLPQRTYFRLRKRFLILALTLTALTALPLLIWVPARVEEQQTEELIRRGRLATELLDKSAIGALTVYDRGALDQIAKGFIRSTDFLYVVILDKDGKLLADSGLEKEDVARVEQVFPQLLRTENDAELTAVWPRTGERAIHLSRPVFYEQLRIGTVVLGISARRVAMQTSSLRIQMLLASGVIVVVGLVSSFLMQYSLSRPLRKIARNLDVLPDAQLESLAGKVEEYNLLVEGLTKQRNLFKNSLGELEAQKLQLEVELAESREEVTGVTSKLGAMSKQVETLQEKLRAMEQQSRHLTRVLPVVEFATGIAPEIDTSMQQISQSAGRLSEDLGRLRNLIDLYEKALPQSQEDLEVIRQYKTFISYERIREAMDELVTTIRGGASWAEQLADILKQLSPATTIKSK